MRQWMARLCALALFTGVSTATALAGCGSSAAGFAGWLEGFKREAAAKGISQGTIASALAGVTYNPSIISKDRHQGVFRQSFEQFSGRMVPPRLGRAAALLKKSAGMFRRIELQFGVPGPVLVAIGAVYRSTVASTLTITIWPRATATKRKKWRGSSVASERLKV